MLHISPSERKSSFRSEGLKDWWDYSSYVIMCHMITGSLSVCRIPLSVNGEWILVQLQDLSYSSKNNNTKNHYYIWYNLRCCNSLLIISFRIMVCRSAVYIAVKTTKKRCAWWWVCCCSCAYEMRRAKRAHVMANSDLNIDRTFRMFSFMFVGAKYQPWWLTYCGTYS